MRHVFTDNDIIAKLWATQAQHHARNKPRNFYFTGNTIYSYGEHFPIASIAEQFGRKYVLYNSRTYSVTTNRHQSAVSWAIHRHLAMLPRLALPLSGAGVDFNSWLQEQKECMQQLIRDLNNPRKINPPTKEDFNAIIDKLHAAEYYLFDHPDPYHLNDFIRPVALDYLLTKAAARKTCRQAKQRLKQAFGCSNYVAGKILQRAHRQAA